MLKEKLFDAVKYIKLLKGSSSLFSVLYYSSFKMILYITGLPRTARKDELYFKRGIVLMD